MTKMQMKLIIQFLLLCSLSIIFILPLALLNSNMETNSLVTAGSHDF